MNYYLFVALLTMSPRAYFGFTPAITPASSKVSPTTAASFRTSRVQDDSGKSKAPSKTSKDVMFGNGPHPALADAILMELCKNELGLEGDNLDDLLDMCYI